jgi:hypothetical protein
MINQSLSSVGLYTKRLRASAPGKPVWMILQGFGWRDLKNSQCYGSEDLQQGRRPNIVELRLMVFDAILNGANGIIYYGTSFIERDSQLWKDVLQVSKELRSLEPVILTKPFSKTPSVTTGNTHGSVDGPEIQLTLRKAGNDWVLIMINTSVYGIPFTLSGLPDSLNGQKLFRLYSDEYHNIKNNEFNDGIAGYGVHIYSTSREFEAK